MEFYLSNSRFEHCVLLLQFVHPLLQASDGGDVRALIRSIGGIRRLRRAMWLASCDVELDDFVGSGDQILGRSHGWTNEQLNLQWFVEEIKKLLCDHIDMMGVLVL